MIRAAPAGGAEPVDTARPELWGMVRLQRFAKPPAAFRPGALALGSLAIGALAIGALAVGYLAIGKLTVHRARIKRLEIDELVIRRVQRTGRDAQPPK